MPYTQQRFYRLDWGQLAWIALQTTGIPHTVALPARLVNSKLVLAILRHDAASLQEVKSIRRGSSFWTPESRHLGA